MNRAEINEKRHWMDRLDAVLTPMVRLMLWSVLFQLIFFVYWPALRAPFVYDDLPCIVTNPDLRFPGEWQRFFSNHESSMQFDHRPLVGLVTMLNFQLSGLDVVPYRIFNLLVHWGVAIMIGETIRKFALHFGLRGGALMGLAVASIWALHPLNTVTVIFISQRMELLMILFYLLTIHLLLGAGKSPGFGRLVMMVASSVACLASKEVGVSLLPFCLVMDRVCHFSSWKELLAKRWPFYVALSIVWIGFIGWWTSGQRIAELGNQPLSNPFLYFQVQCRVLVGYLGKVVWPADLVFVAAPREVEKLSEWIFYGMFLTGLLLTGSWWAAHKSPWIWIPLLLFFMVLGPTSSFLPIPQEAEAEWRMYLPSACFLVFLISGLAWLCSRARRPERWFLASLGMVLFAAGLTARERAADYRTARALWTDNVLKDPLSAKAWINLGVAQFQEKDLKGLEQTSKVLWKLGQDFGHDSTRANALEMKGWIAMEQKQFVVAEDFFKAAIQERDESRFRIDLARSLVLQRKYSEAAPMLEQALQGDPENVFILALYGEVLLSLGQEESGREMWSLAERIAPDCPPLQESRARVREHAGKVPSDPE